MRSKLYTQINRKRGELYVFEGPDEVGKSTLAKELYELLTNKEIACDLFGFPGRIEGTLGKFVYDVHHDPEKYKLNHLDPTALQLMHVASHVDLIENIVRPSLFAGRIVLMDRYWWSTWVYGKTHGARHISLEQMIRLEKQHWGQILPSGLFLVSRNNMLSKKDSTLLFEEYLLLAEQEANKYHVHLIENNNTISVALDTISQIVLEHKNYGRLYTKKSRLINDCCKETELPFREFSKDGPVIINRLTPARPTIAYTAYWQFAAERQAIFYRRIAEQPPAWTKDPILNTYKFTNAYRASDRVSQYLIRNVIYSGDQSPDEVFFRIILFKLFNKIETWEMFCKELGEVRYSGYSFKHYNDILTKAFEKGIRLYSAAYIMPSGSGSFNFKRKHSNHLKVIESMMEQGIPQRIQESRSMKDVFELLLSFPTMGTFLSYQYTIDLNYSNLIDFSEMDFVIPGPGARDGIRKCFEDLGGLSEVDIIKFMAENQDVEFERLGIEFKSLWGRHLQLIDCQNLFCEVDKYVRVKYPELKGLTGRTRIKQKYKSPSRQIQFFYPPKWGLNKFIKEVKSNDLF